MTENFIPYGRQWVDDADIQAVVDVLKGDYLTTGPTVSQFERALADHGGAQFAVAVNSGTAALHAAYFALGLGEGDEIITSPLTFAATSNAALYLGSKVRFVDVLPDTGNLDPALIEASISERTKAIVPVDYAGHPADYDDIRKIADRYGLRIVADAAHSLGASYKGRKVGTLADLTETSFHPVKPITTAEGGAILTNDSELANRASIFRTHGIVREPSQMLNPEGPWSYEMQHLGFNYRLTDLQCALGTSQLTKLGRFISRRREIATFYLDALKDLEGIKLPSNRDFVEHGWHLFVIRIAGDASKRLSLFNRLRELNLGVQVHYMPVYLHPFYQSLGYQAGICPIAEDFYARSISIPIFPRMTDHEAQSVVDRIKQAVKEIIW